jgi:N-methylhydantoinase B
MIDPITTEIIRHSFISAADEMKINLARSSYNPVVFEMHDFAVGIFDADANMISQAPGLPVFLGTLRENIKVVEEDIGGPDKFQPGDLYITNDPYAGGTHLLDVTCVAPVFVNDRIMGFSVAKTHWLDIGGKDAGSYSNDSTNIHQEGIRFRSVKLYESGELIQSVMGLIRYNIRLGESVLGDLRAQIAACRTGEKRFKAIVEKYGEEAVLRAKEEFMDHAERMTRRAVERIPDGRYQADGWLDNDSLHPNGKHLPIRVAVTVEGSQMSVDLTGSQEQNEGPINCGLAATMSAVRVGFKCVTTPGLPINEGSFRSLHVIVPENSMFNAKYPAPCCQFGRHLLTMIDTFLKALALNSPHKVPAGHYCDLGILSMSGVHPRNGHDFIHVDSSSGGWGGSEGLDGESCLIAIQDGDSKNVPTELLEQKYPLRVRRFCLRQDSGGPGRYRGGLGHIRDFEILTDTIKLLTSVERHGYKPWGMSGGLDGMSNNALLNPGTRQERQIRKVTNFALRYGSVLSMLSGGGGGFGLADERSPERVLDDVVNGYVSPALARSEYKCIVRKTQRAYTLDQDGTRALRSLRRSRLKPPTNGKRNAL